MRNKSNPIWQITGLMFLLGYAIEYPHIKGLLSRFAHSWIQSALYINGQQCERGEREFRMACISLPMLPLLNQARRLPFLFSFPISRHPLPEYQRCLRFPRNRVPWAIERHGGMQSSKLGSPDTIRSASRRRESGRPWREALSAGAWGRASDATSSPFKSTANRSIQIVQQRDQRK
jgi:hypothetical protein